MSNKKIKLHTELRTYLNECLRLELLQYETDRDWRVDVMVRETPKKKWNSGMTVCFGTYEHCEMVYQCLGGKLKTIMF